jgi:hypothetical protein
MLSSGKTASLLAVAVAVVLLALIGQGCGALERPGGPPEKTQSVSASVISACASGTNTQVFTDSGLVGCAGKVTWPERGTLCALGYHVASADEFVKLSNGVAPLHDYWVDDPLLRGGTLSGKCSANYTSGTPCPSDRPMRVCIDSGLNDPEGNTCHFQRCGLNSTTSNDHFGGCNWGLTAGALCVPNGCANGSISQTFSGGLIGCAGSVPWTQRASLCGPGYRTATAVEWESLFGGTAPSHNYWTDDNLPATGSMSGSCYADWDGASCGSTGGSPTPMRICVPTGTDPEGNTCTMTNCGFRSASPSEFFGGCVGNASAGTLCVPQVGCASGEVDQTIAPLLHGCKGQVMWSSRDQLCAPGWQATSGFFWNNMYQNAVPLYSYWTKEQWNVPVGSTSQNCAAILDSGVCEAGSPMRLCTALNQDPLGNNCEITNCGLNTNSPNEYFGGCQDNSAGALCGGGDLKANPYGFKIERGKMFAANTTSEVNAGCVTAGTHDVLEFALNAENWGTGDISLGAPPPTPPDGSTPTVTSPVFTWNPGECEWEAAHFNEFSLTRNDGTLALTGFKAGMCLEDVSPLSSYPYGTLPSDSTQHIGCGEFQGISPGMADVYDVGSECQLVVIDNALDGDYTFTVTTNARKVVKESDYSNNTTTVQLNITGDMVMVK